MMKDNMVYVLVFDDNHYEARIVGVYRTEAGAEAAKIEDILDDAATINDYLDYCHYCADDDEQPKKFSDWVSEHNVNEEYYRIERVEMMN